MVLAAGVAGGCTDRVEGDMDVDAGATRGDADSGGSGAGEPPGASDGPQTAGADGVDEDTGVSGGGASGGEAPDLPACPGPDCTICGTPESWPCLAETACPEGTLAEIDYEQTFVGCFTGRCLAPEDCDVGPACDCDEGSVCTLVENASDACIGLGFRCVPIPDGCDPERDPLCICGPCDEPGLCGTGWSDAPGDQVALVCPCQDG